MYRVAICEDETGISLALKQICHEILDKLEIAYEIHQFESGEGFFSTFSAAQNRFDLMLLDIMMPEPNGIELARLIRQEDSDGTIIFVTSNPDYALLGYDVQALHYLMKPVDKTVLERLIVSDYKGRFQTNFYVFKQGTQKLRVAVKEILSLETVGRKVAVTMRSGTVTYSGKLSDLLAELPKEQFVRCHQAFALNVRNIRELGHHEAITVNGNSVPVSRTFTRDVERAFVQYLRDL